MSIFNFTRHREDKSLNPSLELLHKDLIELEKTEQKIWEFYNNKDLNSVYNASKERKAEIESIEAYCYEISNKFQSADIITRLTKISSQIRNLKNMLDNQKSSLALLPTFWHLPQHQEVLQGYSTKEGQSEFTTKIFELLKQVKETINFIEIMKKEIEDRLAEEQRVTAEKLAEVKRNQEERKAAEQKELDEKNRLAEEEKRKKEEMENDPKIANFKKFTKLNPSLEELKPVIMTASSSNNGLYKKEVFDYMYDKLDFMGVTKYALENNLLDLLNYSIDYYIEDTIKSRIEHYKIDYPDLIKEIIKPFNGTYSFLPENYLQKIQNAVFENWALKGYVLNSIRNLDDTVINNYFLLFQTIINHFDYYKELKKLMEPDSNSIFTGVEDFLKIGPREYINSYSSKESVFYINNIPYSYYDLRLAYEEDNFEEILFTHPKIWPVLIKIHPSILFDHWNFSKKLCEMIVDIHITRLKIIFDDYESCYSSLMALKREKGDINYNLNRDFNQRYKLYLQIYLDKIEVKIIFLEQKLNEFAHQREALHKSLIE